MTFQPDELCTKCSGYALPGTVATAKYVQEKFLYTSSKGIYSCRNIAGTNRLSKHSCGRAWDCGIPMFSSGAANTKLGFPVVEWFKKYSTELGIIEIIYNRVIYDDASPSGRFYGGVSPHLDHIHETQTKAKALSLTYDKIVAFAGPTVWTPPSPVPPSKGYQVYVVRNTIKKGSKGPNVEIAQSLLARVGFPPANTFDKNHKPDGIFGSGMETATKNFQKAKKITSDGVIGPTTWAKLEAL